MSRLLRRAGLLGAGAALAAVGTPTLAHAQHARSASCARCDSTRLAELQRDLERARRDLDATARALLAQQLALEGDNSAARRAAVARARQDLRDAERSYTRLNTKMAQLETATSSAYREALRSSMEDAMAAQRSAQEMAQQQPAGWLGVWFSADPESADSGSGEHEVVYRSYPVIEAVEPGSPAARAGIIAGDSVIMIAGRDVRKGVPPFTKLLVPGKKLPIRLSRGGDQRDVLVIVARRPRESTYALIAPTAPAHPDAVYSPGLAPMPAMPAMPAMPVFSFGGGATIAGAELRPVGDLQDYFGVAKGILVLRVKPETDAARAGLRGGDVIVAASGKPTYTVEALMRVLSAADDGDHIRLDIVRKKHKQKLVLER